MTRTDPSAAAGIAVVRRPRRVRAFGVVALVVVLVGVAFLSIAVGSRGVGWSDIVAGLGGSTETFGEAVVAKRFPRTVLALVAGAGLGIAGAVMQGVTRNPLADPGILGINTGALLAIAIGIAWFGIDSAAAHIWVAILGAGVVAVFVYVIGSLGHGGATPLKLALAGVATTAALLSFTRAIVLPRTDIADSVQSWQIGGVGGGTWDSLALVGPFLLAGFVICLLSARGLNLLALGDELAAGLGQRVALARAAASVGAVVLCGAITAVTGPISFVGLVVPHVCRLIVGVDHRWLIPFSALTGAALLTVADVLGRIVAYPGEISVGIITAFVGAPFFIWIVRRQKVREL